MNDETVRDVCEEITDATMRVGAFFTPTIYGWRDRILAAHEREMKSVRQCLNGDCERFKLGAEPCMTCTVYAYEREISAKDAEIARLKAALKPLMEFDEYQHDKTLNALRAVREAQCIMKEGETK